MNTLGCDAGPASKGITSPPSRGTSSMPTAPPIVVGSLWPGNPTIADPPGRHPKYTLIERRLPRCDTTMARPDPGLELLHTARPRHAAARCFEHSGGDQIGGQVRQGLHHEAALPQARVRDGEVLVGHLPPLFPEHV